MSDEPIPDEWADEPLRRKGAKFIGTLPAGSRIERLRDGRLIAVHPSGPPKIIDANGVRNISLTAEDLAAIGALKFPSD